ncbi:uncharacterized protein NECHADRAFT_101054 [Fusarium vanettenii 77-13-4]|uniref:AB hydrolase-1 domain-containing protein n=1 Tax=Fusarium vanettenii (strain ATCC MYA-4622 / CBS 123669 / FGSC 9596 / NRRL 45880 / 77-13-4) TaxID=660122 RepID=C7ZQ34_FUSV7|nr:uncharacterized protein NECHADRAFT_101054 [Fusarium vanettenii 77-13-4]EEU33859.1 hypothetical protein NECHADRAFT_101054 [Fusarium vanettenii 77-13-4]
MPTATGSVVYARLCRERRPHSSDSDVTEAAGATPLSIPEIMTANQDPKKLKRCRQNDRLHIFFLLFSNTSRRVINRAFSSSAADSTVFFAMVETSVWDYVFIRTCIFLLHLIAPLSVAYSLVGWLVHIPLHAPRILKIWLALEAAFYLLVYLPRKAYLQRAATHPTIASRNDRQRLFWRCHGNIPDPDRFLTKWFRDAPAAEIKRENVKDFYRWAFLNTAEPDPAYDEELEEEVGTWAWQREVPQTDARQGRDVTSEPDMVSVCVYCRYDNVYLPALLLLRLPPCEELDCILKAHGWERFVLVSHSFGSVVATHLLHTPQIARKIGPILFVDPVSFLLHLPDVAYNFVYRKPCHANEHLLSYFGSKDMGISHTLFRRFFWTDNILWKEDIQGHRVTVVLGGRDAIIDTKVIGAYLTGSDDWNLETTSWKDGVWKGDGLDVLWFHDLDHGQVFKGRRTRMRLVDIVRRFCVEE